MGEENATIKKITVKKDKKSKPKKIISTKPNLPTIKPLAKVTDGIISSQPLSQLNSGFASFDQNNTTNFEHRPDPRQNILMKNFLSELTTKINKKPLD